MPSRSEILAALQFSHIAAQKPLNASWGERLTLSYQFAGASQPGDLPGNTVYDGWTAFTEAEKETVRAALAHVETFLNVDFVEVSGAADPDLNFGQPDLQSASNMSLSNWVSGLGGYWLTSSGAWDGYVLFDNSLDLSGEMNLILHELGHALGLDHSFDNVALDPSYDTNHFTVMSYTVDPESLAFNSAMMLFDVLALQDIWGKAAYNTGDTTYTGPRTPDVDVVWDSGGYDTFDASATSHGVTLDLRQGAFSTFGDHEDLAVAYGVRIEAAVGGSGDDTINGNGFHNRLSGGAGHDRIDAGSGRDRLYGGEGNDVLIGGGGNDRLFGDAGDDTLYGGGGRNWLYGGADNDALYGGRGRNLLSGQDGDDRLFGGGGNDRLGGGDGNDLLAGGGGRDLLWGNAGEDTFLFTRGARRDVVRDFENDVDTLHFEGFGTLSDVLDAAKTRNGNTFFKFGADVLVIKHVALHDLIDDLAVI